MNRNLQISRRLHIVGKSKLFFLISFIQSTFFNNVLFNSIKTDGKGKPIPNAGAWFLRGNPIVKKYLLQGENKWVFQRKPLSWTTKKWAVMLMVPNVGLCYTILNGEDQFNKAFGTNQTTGCYNTGKKIKFFEI